MKQRDHALKLALRSKMEHDRRLFTTLRKVVKDLRKTKATFLLSLLMKLDEIVLLKKYGRI